MVHVYAALSGSSKDGYEIQVQSSSSELKVALCLRMTMLAISLTKTIAMMTQLCCISSQA